MKPRIRSGTTVLKFWLKVGKDEQAQRLLKRIDDPDRNWKFNAGDVAERAHWADYHHAFEEALNATSRNHAPWYCIPADDKPFMRHAVADIVLRTMQAMDPQFPEVSESQRLELLELRGALTD